MIKIVIKKIPRYIVVILNSKLMNQAGLYVTQRITVCWQQSILKVQVANVMHIPDIYLDSRTLNHSREFGTPWQILVGVASQK